MSQFEDMQSLKAVFPTSALKGTGVEDIRTWAVSQLPEGPSFYPKVKRYYGSLLGHGAWARCNICSSELTTLLWRTGHRQ